MGIISENRDLGQNPKGDTTGIRIDWLSQKIAQKSSQIHDHHGNANAKIGKKKR